MNGFKAGKALKRLSRPRRSPHLKSSSLSELSNHAMQAMRKGSNAFLRSAALVVTDRRWAAPLSAMALGFGLFVGVAIGPGASGTFATGAAQILEIPSLASSADGEEAEVTEEPALAESSGGGGGGGAFEATAAPLPYEPALAEPLPEEEPAPEASSPTPATPEAEGPEEETAESTELKGTVVTANPQAGSYALSIKGGELVPVHASKLPAAGTKLTVLTHQLANGTFAEDTAPKTSGKAAKATLRGVVTFVDPDPAAPAYTLSGRGASLLIRVKPDPTGVAPTLPQVGAYATVVAEIGDSPAASAPLEETAATPAPEPTCVREAAPAGQGEPATVPAEQGGPASALWQSEIELEETPPSTYLDLSGTITAICTGTGQLLLSADGLDESEADLALEVPSSIKTNKLKVGDSFLATATVEEDGSLSLEGLASDEQLKGADDPKAAQGDLKRRL